MSGVFSHEQEIVRKCRKNLEDNVFSSKSDSLLYSQLLKEYEKFLSNTIHITNIADKVSGNLNTNKKVLSTKVNIDELTGLYNRRFLKEQLPKTIHNAVIRENAVSSLLIDIDFFKNYNDTYGHIKGDNCLKVIADCIKDSIEHSNDYLVRYGGEEFLIVLPNTSEIDAIYVANRIIRKVEQLTLPNLVSPHNGCLTVSIGVATIYPINTSNEQEVVNRADKALYAAKEAGRNCVKVYKE